jgi:hypothetical protein
MKKDLQINAERKSPDSLERKLIASQVQGELLDGDAPIKVLTHCYRFMPTKSRRFRQEGRLK